ncbi:MAG: hypothetical protein ACKOA2_04985 [Ilumatobacteraceae bacterium]
MQVEHVGAAMLPRRQLLGLGVGAGVGVLVGASPAAAADSRQPTEADVTLLAKAQQLELAMRAVYDDVIADVPGWSDDEAALMVALREAHEEFANALSATLGRSAPGTVDDRLVRRLRNGVGARPADALVGMWSLESAAVATHAAVLGNLESSAAAELTVAIQLGEARHCTALAHLAGITDTALLLVDDEAAPIEVDG